MKSIVLIIITLCVILASCDPYSKLSKSSNLKDRDTAAMHYFSVGNFESAAFLFEELMGIYRGDSSMERYMYYYSRAKFLSADYYTAAYYFDQYTQQYPSGSYSEDCAFMRAYSYYKLSNDYNLDQTESVKAYEAFQLYLTQYQYGKRKVQANNLMYEIKDKLAHKAYYQADQFLKIQHYKAATQAFKTMLLTYPESRYKEQGLFKLLKSSVLLAEHSAEEKKEMRYLDAITHYQKLVERFPNTRNKKEAEGIYANIQKALQKIKPAPQPIVTP